jgi:AmmeMemoRadiSam system protein B
LTAIAIEALKPDSIVEDGACGRIPVCGLLLAAAAHGLRAQTLDLRNSGDTGGPRDRVVGYGAFAFEEQCHQ